MAATDIDFEGTGNNGTGGQAGEGTQGGNGGNGYGLLRCRCRRAAAENQENAEGRSTQKSVVINSLIAICPLTNRLAYANIDIVSWY